MHRRLRVGGEIRKKDGYKLMKMYMEKEIFAAFYDILQIEYRSWRKPGSGKQIPIPLHIFDLFFYLQHNLLQGSCKFKRTFIALSHWR